MPVSTGFTEQVQAHLNERAEQDPLFANTLKKEGKSIEECVNYILETVQKSGVQGWADSEIYNMAVHYYDEDDIKAEKAPSNVRVVVNHVVELSAEDKENARKEALNKAIAQEQQRIAKKPVASKKPVVDQPSLF